MRIVTLALRLICIGAVLAAGAVIFADYHAHTQAWLAYWHFMGGLERPGYQAGEIRSAVIGTAPWLVTAALQAITIRRQSIPLDCARGFSLLLACISITTWWPEVQFWNGVGSGPFGEPPPQGDFDGWLDVFLSYPVCFATVLAVALNQIYSRVFAGQPAPIK